MYNNSNNEEVLAETVAAADRSIPVRPYSYCIPVVDNAGLMFTVAKYNGSSSFVMVRDEMLTFVTNGHSYVIPNDLVLMKANAPLTPSTSASRDHVDSGVGVSCDFESKIDKLVKDENFMKQQSELLNTYVKKNSHKGGARKPQVLTIDNSDAEEQEEMVPEGRI